MPVPTHPPTHAPFPPSRYQGTAARATWCSGWAWLGFPKISRACLLLASSISRASPLLLLCPCLCSRPPPRHDTTRPNPARFGRRLLHQRPSRRRPAFSSPRRRHQPTVELTIPPSPRKNTRVARAWIAIPQRLSPKPTTTNAGPTQPS